MNRLFKLSIMLVLSAAMLLASFSAFAATDDELTLDIRLMQEFYSQPCHNGDISNGTEILSTFYQHPTEYDHDSIEQLMLMNNMTWENNYLHTFTNYVTPYIPNPCFIGADVFLGGNLILSETQVSEVRLFMAGTPSIHANNCPNLTAFSFITPVCRANDIEIVGGAPVTGFDVKARISSVRVDLAGFENTFTVKCLGRGYLDMERAGRSVVFRSSTYSDSTMHRYFCSGELIGSNAEGDFVIGAEDGISNVTMVYGGDVNADGSISLPDALTIMRSAMGIIPQLELDDADMNADDAVQLDDAIVLARLCLGIE